nr:hypothetical protein BaRGS_027179 [Batillaria attramentaria]
MGRPLNTVVFDSTYYPAVAVSFVFFLTLFKFVSPTLSTKLSEGYNQLTNAQQIDWNTRRKFSAIDRQ